MRPPINKKLILISLISSVLLVIIAITFLSTPQDKSLKITNTVALEKMEVQSNKNKEMNKNNRENFIRIDASFSDSEIMRLTANDFTQYLQETQENIPTIKDFQNISSSDAHHFPSIMMELGQYLGVIRRILKIRPEFTNLAQNFYHNCSHEHNYPASVRALCLINIIKEHPNDFDEIAAQYPAEVRELAKSAYEL